MDDSQIAFTSFIIGCILAGTLVFFFMPTTTEMVYEEKVQPMLMVEFSEWHGIEENPSQSAFNYFIYNYGNVEAKNVKVRCEVTNLYTDELIKEQIFSVGNIASNGYEFMENYMDYTIDYNLDNVGAACYLESADGEYINLYERLDDIE